MTAIPKPPPPIKNKGAKEWDAFRQLILSVLYAVTTNDDFGVGTARCDECDKAMDIFKDGKRYTCLAHFHHKNKRLSHAEDKYSMDNIECLCKSCHRKEHP